MLSENLEEAEEQIKKIILWEDKVLLQVATYIYEIESNSFEQVLKPKSRATDYMPEV